MNMIFYNLVSDYKWFKMKKSKAKESSTASLVESLLKLNDDLVQQSQPYNV